MIGTGSNISPGKRLCRLLLKQSDLSLFLQGSSTCFTHKQNDKCRLQYSCNLSTNKALTELLVWLYFCSSHLTKTLGVSLQTHLLVHHREQGLFQVVAAPSLASRRPNPEAPFYTTTQLGTLMRSASAKEKSSKFYRKVREIQAHLCSFHIGQPTVANIWGTIAQVLLY